MGTRPARRAAPNRLSVALLLLDTTVLIDVLRGRPAGIRLLALRRTGTVPATSAINVEEIVRGLWDSEQAAVDRLLSGLRLLSIGRPEAELAGNWRRQFARAGVTLHQADCLIAATAVSAGARFATGNGRDFPMPELALEDWPVGG